MELSPWCRHVQPFDIATQHSHLQRSWSRANRPSHTNHLNNKTSRFKQIHDFVLVCGIIHSSTWPHMGGGRVAFYELQGRHAYLVHAKHTCSQALSQDCPLSPYILEFRSPVHRTMRTTPFSLHPSHYKVVVVVGCSTRN